MKTWSLGFALTTLLLVSTATTRGETGGDVEAARVRSLEQDLRRLRGVEERLRRETRGVLGELEAVARDVAIADRELELVRARLAIGARRLNELESELATTTSARARRKAALIRILRDAHERRLPDGMAAVLMSGDPSALDRNLQHLERLGDAEKEALRSFTLQEARIRETRAEFALEIASQAKLRLELEARRRDLAAGQQRKQHFLANLGGRSAEAAAEIKAAARSLRELLQTIDRAPLPGTEPIHTDFVGAKGSMPWPVEGPLRRRFGVERHPRFNTLIENQGLEIDAQAGTVVRSVHSGEVAFANWFEAYGFLVILDHGDDYYTLYANLGRLEVKVGDRVAKRQVLGAVGDASAVDGPGLRFELRRGPQAVNPEPWLTHR